LDEEKRNSDFVIKLIKEGEVTYSKDVSKGGLVGSTIKLSLQISKGVNVDFSNMYYHGNRLESLFSESGGRFLVLTSKGDEVIDLAKSNGIVARKIGEINDEYEINLGGIRLRWEEVKKSWRKLNEVM
jgi:Phosphoribosylformylglycinamidine (FGAM) synthase, synthetase domain